MVEKVLLCGLEQTSYLILRGLIQLGFGFCPGPWTHFFLMEPDVEQDLDWTMAGNQSKTVTDLKCFCLETGLVAEIHY